MAHKIKTQGDDLPDFSLVNNEIYKNFFCREGATKTHKWKRIVPVKNRAEVNKRSNDAPKAGNLGFHKTLDKVQAYFHWPKMREIIGQYVQSCEVCEALHRNVIVSRQQGSKVDELVDHIKHIPVYRNTAT